MLRLKIGFIKRSRSAESLFSAGKVRKVFFVGFTADRCLCYSFEKSFSVFCVSPLAQQLEKLQNC